MKTSAMAPSFSILLIQLFILMALFKGSNGLVYGKSRMRPSPMRLRMVEDTKNGMVPQESEKKRETFGGPAYFQGLITEPIAPEKTTKVDGKERDNLTPNLKFGAILSGVVFGLFELFMFANKDLAPPPY